MCRHRRKSPAPCVALPELSTRRRAVAGLLLALALASAAVSAKGLTVDPEPWASERGLPPVRVFALQDLQTAQLFSVAVSDRRLYAGTLGGLAVYDGAQWRITPSARALYAMAASAAGRVIAGGPDMLSEVRSEGSETTLASLLETLPAADRAIGDVRSLHADGEAFLIVTDRLLLRLRGHALEVLRRWPSDPRRRGFLSGHRLYIASGGPLVAIDASSQDAPDAPDALTAWPAAARGAVSFVTAPGPSRQLAGVEGEGLFVGDGGTWRPIAREAGAALQHGLVEARLLSTGAVAIATSRSGLALLTPVLAFDRMLSRPEGLPANRVVHLDEDAEGGLWVAGESQLARVDLGSPLTLIDERMGLEGSVARVVRHRGTLHVLTSSGLFVVEPTATARLWATRVPAVTGRAWDALERGDHLLVATSAGVFDRHGQTTTLVPGTANLWAYTLAAPAGDPATVLVGTRTGLSQLARSGDGWRLARHVVGAPRYVRSIVSRPGGRLYVGTVFDGVVRLDLTSPTVPPQPLRPGEMHVNENGGVIYAMGAEPGSFWQVDETHQALVAPPPPARQVDEHALRFAFAPDGALWTAGRGAERFAPGRAASRQMLDHSVSVQSLDVDADGTVWLGSSVGLWRYGGVSADGPGLPTPSLERVYMNDEPIDAAGPMTLPYGVERLRFEFSPNTFSGDALTEFRLEPLDRGWSRGRRGQHAEYTSLPEGDYTLHVRAAADSAASAEQTWRFNVLPPWHRRADVRALELTGLIGLAVSGVQLRTRRLRRRASDLEDAVAAKTAALQHANARLAEIARRDELTGLHNRRHFEESLALEWARAHRTHSALALAMVDIDHFKALNDTYGHVEGDRTLEAVARVIGGAARRQGDVVARYGGEEFAVLLPNGSPDGIRALAESVRATVEALELPSPRGRGVVTVSVGIAAFEAPATLEPTIVAAADAALYRAKSAGRNRVAD